MINTYRKWIYTEDVFYISSKDDDENEVGYYCEAPYYEDSFWFQEKFIKEESIKANWREIVIYNIKKLGYKLN